MAKADQGKNINKLLRDAFEEQSNKNVINYLHVNLNSLNNETNYQRLLSLIENVDLDVIGVSSTRFQGNFPREIPGFELFYHQSLPRQKGVALYVKEGIACDEELISADGREFDYILVPMTKNDTKICVMACYLHSNPQRLDNMRSMFDEVRENLLGYEHFLIMGDFDISGRDAEISLREVFPGNTPVFAYNHMDLGFKGDWILIPNKEKNIFVDHVELETIYIHPAIFGSYNLGKEVVKNEQVDDSIQKGVKNLNLN